MRQKLQRFMMGRYGNDGLNRFLMIVALVCLVISFFGPSIFYMLGLIFMGYAYFRMFSRQTYKRALENQKFYQWEMKVKSAWKRKKNEFAQRKDYRIYKCPNCKQKIRVPKGRGKIAITCRKCGTEFVKKS
jgi:DNA-directed RNA polymerase subunit RPC12/RpoP